MLNNNVEVYNTQEEVARRIEELKTQGYQDSDLYVIAKGEHTVDNLGGRTQTLGDSDEITEERTLWDRFVDFLGGGSSDDYSDTTFDRLDLNDTDREHYLNEINSGRILLYIDRDGLGGGTGTREATIADTMRNTDTLVSSGHTIGTDDMTDRTDRTGFTDTGMDSGLGRTRDLDREGDEVIQLKEERLNVEKERVSAGEVRIDKEVRSEQKTVEVPIEREEVTIERRRVDERPATGESFREDDESIVIPVMEERVRVTKEPVVTEEIVVGKRKVQDTKTVQDTVRKEYADIDENVNTNRTDEVLDRDTTTGTYGTDRDTTGIFGADRDRDTEVTYGTDRDTTGTFGSDMDTNTARAYGVDDDLNTRRTADDTEGSLMDRAKVKVDNAWDKTRDTFSGDGNDTEFHDRTDMADTTDRTGLTDDTNNINNPNNSTDTSSTNNKRRR